MGGAGPGPVLAAQQDCTVQHVPCMCHACAHPLQPILVPAMSQRKQTIDWSDLTPPVPMPRVIELEVETKRLAKLVEQHHDALCNERGVLKSVPNISNAVHTRFHRLQDWWKAHEFHTQEEMHNMEQQQKYQSRYLDKLEAKQNTTSSIVGNIVATLGSYLASSLCCCPVFQRDTVAQCLEQLTVEECQEQLEHPDV